MFFNLIKIIILYLYEYMKIFIWIKIIIQQYDIQISKTTMYKQCFYLGYDEYGESILVGNIVVCHLRKFQGATCQSILVRFAFP